MAAPEPTAPAPFSRLQLAAALLEYDNDPSDPDCPFRSAADSVIFAQFRKPKKERALSVVSRRSADHLSVKAPGDRGSVAGRESTYDNHDSRKSRASIDMLRNPFSPAEEDVEEEDEDEENMDDLDLESWGLNDLLGDKEKEKGSKRKASHRLPNPHEIQYAKGPLSPGLGPRAVSMGNFDNIGFGGAIVDDLSIQPGARAGTEFLDERKRRASFGSPLDLVGMNAPHISLDKARRKSAYGVLETLPEPGPSSSHAIPFPSSVPHVGDDLNAGIPHHERTYSSTSQNSRVQSTSDEPGRRPRFDSQGNRIKTTAPPQASIDDENNPFAIRPPSPSRTSRFDPKAVAHVRTLSNASMASRIILEEPPSAHPPAPRKYPRMELLRPKLLIMPSPLQSSDQNARPPSPTVRDGFQLSRDGPPLPAGARAVRKSMAFEDLPPNPFTPNSRATLSLAQLTFRSGLHSQDTGYSENVGMPRVTSDGEQVRLPSPEPEDIPVIATPPEEKKDRRGPGKLYGKSLIDDLEARKAALRGKRRVFTGDERPSMMARSATHSTLIDPNSLNRPVSQQMDTSNSGQNLARRRTLLNLDEDKLAPPGPMRKSTTFGPRVSNVKSVFGTDHIWERETAKLRAIEAREREAAGLSAEPPATTEANSEMDPYEIPPQPQSQASANLLPEIAKVSARKGPPPPRGDDEDDESDSDHTNPPLHKEADADAEWFSDEENPDGPVRTVGSGPRYPEGRTDPPAKQKPKYTPASPADDSDEDLPLAATVGKAAQRAARVAAEEESDEDKPLNALIDKTKSKLFLGVPESKQPSKGGDEDEDDQPLGLRASQFNPGASQNWLGRSGDDEEEDDVPLGLHPEHQRRTQYQMLAQQQQFAQQQMMMQAQLQNSMMFSQPSFMGPSFYGPPTGMGIGIGPVMGDMSMMVPPIAPGTPPPVRDPAKFGRVDEWRRGVAVEGEPV